jgi:hypothetical protein
LEGRKGGAGGGAEEENQCRTTLRLRRRPSPQANTRAGSPIQWFTPSLLLPSTWPSLRGQARPRSARPRPQHSQPSTTPQPRRCEISVVLCL